MISERTITMIVYNVYCDRCGARGPDGLSEVDAHIVARQAGWEIIEHSYVCPDPSHPELKTLGEYLKEQHDSSALMSWWR